MELEKENEKILSVHLMGGLGNQLFQIFTCIAYGYRVGRRVMLPYSDVLTSGTMRYTYWNTLLSGIKHLTTADDTEYTIEKLSKFDTFQESGFRYQEIPLFNNLNVRLYGYFQSPQYFIRYYNEICSLLNLTDKLKAVRTKCSQHFRDDGRTVSMHFRLGDYKQIQDCHPLMPVDYYRAALFHILSRRSITKCNVLYFCQKQDEVEVSNVISRLKNTFQNVNFIKVDDELSDWEEMLLMANCDDNIIANSTFSWWGAFFNKNTTKLVCYPSVWFGPKLKHNVVDLFPSDWQQINW